MAPERCSRSTLGPKGSNSASCDLPQPLAGRLLIPDRRADPVQSAVGIDVAELSQPVFGVTGRPGMADLLGHSSIAITGDIYGHTSDNTARAAVEGLSSALGI